MKRLNALTEFARVINSDRYQYTESDIFLMENMEHKMATFDVFFGKRRTEVLPLWQVFKKFWI